MRLLFITQKLDKGDGPLGFVHGWVAAFSEKYEKVTVICLEQGDVQLPQKVTTLSLGKETRISRLQYVFRFWKYIFTYRNDYDTVLVHMNQEYVLLGALLWKFLGKRVGLWYNHPVGTWKTRFAVKFVDVVFHTSPYAFTAGTDKSRRMPAGIDLKLFAPQEVPRDENEVLFLGRIAPIKRLHVLVEAIGLLGTGTSLHLSVYGAALPEHAEYATALLTKALKQGERPSFNPSVPNTQTPQLYSKAGVFVNLSPAGNYDKTVLEAMACDALVVVSSLAFADVVPPEFFFVEGDAQSLSETLKRTQDLSHIEREELRKRYRTYVSEHHSLALLCKLLGQHLKAERRTG